RPGAAQNVPSFFRGHVRRRWKRSEIICAKTWRAVRRPWRKRKSKREYNDEARMTNDELMSNDRTVRSSFHSPLGFRHSFVIHHLGFVILIVVAWRLRYKVHRMHSINRSAEMRQESPRVGERPLFPLPKTPNELELQARWFAGEFGRKFQTLTGERV